MSTEHQVTVHRFEASLFPVNAYLVETTTGVVVIDATLGVSDARALRARLNVAAALGLVTSVAFRPSVTMTERDRGM